MFPFGEATITLEDVVVLGGFSLFGDPVFTSLQGEEMRQIEEKLISARNELYKTKTGAPRASLWMEFFIGKASKIEHEAFIVTWLSIFVLPNKNLLVKCTITHLLGSSLGLGEVQKFATKTQVDQQWRPCTDEVAFG